MDNLDFSNVGQPLTKYHVEVQHGNPDLARNWYARPTLATNDLDEAIESAHVLMAHSADGWNIRARVTDADDNVVWP